MKNSCRKYKADFQNYFSRNQDLRQIYWCIWRDFLQLFFVLLLQFCHLLTSIKISACKTKYPNWTYTKSRFYILFLFNHLFWYQWNSNYYNINIFCAPCLLSDFKSWRRDRLKRLTSFCFTSNFDHREWAALSVRHINDSNVTLGLTRYEVKPPYH